MAFQQLEDSIRNILKRVGALENAGGSNSGSGSPAGSILAWSVATIPANYAEANGQELDRTDNSDLFAICGIEFGAGDGSTTFNVPNLSGRVIVASDVSQLDFDSLGKTGGATTHTLTDAEVPDTRIRSDNTVSNQGWRSTGGTYGFTGSGSPYAQLMGADDADGLRVDGGGGAHNNLQPYMALKYIIKLSGGIGVLDNTIESVLIDRMGVVEGRPVAINKLFNGNFRINQRAYASGASLASGAYGLDRWKATAASTTLTFTAAPNGQAVTINADKGIYQIIERENIGAGTYTLSWEGTATARVYSEGGTAPAYASSPITATLDGLANVVVGFTAVGATKTLSKVQLEVGSLAHSFSEISYGADLANCQRYYYRVTASAINGRISNAGFQVNTTRAEVTVSLPLAMRVAPSIGASNCYWTDGVVYNMGLSAIGSVYGTALPNAASVHIWVSFSSAAGANSRPGIISAAGAGAYLEFGAEL
jgi:microcystin-dependent protein